MNIIMLRLCAFRYALGRQTYVVHEMVDELTRNWKEMAYFQKQIHDDIVHHLRIDRSDVYASEWQKLLDLEINYEENINEYQRENSRKSKSCSM